MLCCDTSWQRGMILVVLHAHKKVILPCAYGTFDRVCAIDVWRSVLDASLLCGNKRFDIFGCFIVKFVEERFETMVCEPLVDLAVCTKKFFFGLLDGNRSNCIGIEDVEYYNIRVAAV